MLAEISPITVNIPMWSIYATAGLIIGIPSVLLITKKIKRQIKERDEFALQYYEDKKEKREQLRQKNEQERQKEIDDKAQRLEKLLNEPWISIYKTCLTIPYQLRYTWLVTHTSRRAGLPKISPEAIMEFVRIAPEEDKAMALLGQYMYTNLLEPENACTHYWHYHGLHRKCSVCGLSQQQNSEVVKAWRKEHGIS